MTTNHNLKLLDEVFELTQVDDYECAHKLIKPEAEKGDANFEHMLGAFYMEGKFVEQNFDLAVYWLTKSALKDMSNSQALLGQILAFNLGGLGNLGVEIM